MNPLSQPVKFVRYVESRRIHLPKMLSEPAFKLTYESVNLGVLQARWANLINSEQFWLKHRVGMKPICSSWYFDFDGTMMADIQVVRDPADVYSSETDVSSKRLSIVFNRASINEIDNRLSSDARRSSTDKPPSELFGKLQSLTLSIAYHSPFGNVISVFRPRDKIEAQDFEEETNLLAMQIDKLWPVFFVILTDLTVHARHQKRNGTERTVNEEEMWSDMYYPFQIPPCVQNMRLRDFDPSWEYSYSLFVFLCDTPEQMTAWKNDLKVPLKTVGNSHSEMISVSWAMTVWELPIPLPDSELIDRAIRVGLHSDTFKLTTFFIKLASTLLEANHLHDTDLSPEEMRRAVYQYHALKHKFLEKRRLLNIIEFQHFRTMNDLNELEDDLNSAQYLGDLVIKAAEGLEEKSNQRFERKIQFIAIFFTILTIAALGMDAYNFIVGSANEAMDHSIERWLFLTRLSFALVTLMLLVAAALVRIRFWRKRHK